MLNGHARHALRLVRTAHGSVYEPLPHAKASPELHQNPDGQSAQSAEELRPLRSPTVPGGQRVGAEEPSGQKEARGHNGGSVDATALQSLPCGHLPAHCELRWPAGWAEPRMPAAQRKG